MTAYKDRIDKSKARLDVELRNVAKKLTHRSISEFQTYVRQRCNVAITDEYAAQLMKDAKATEEAK